MEFPLNAHFHWGGCGGFLWITRILRGVTRRRCPVFRRARFCEPGFLNLDTQTTCSVRLGWPLNPHFQRQRVLVLAFLSLSFSVLRSIRAKAKVLGRKARCATPPKQSANEDVWNQRDVPGSHRRPWFPTKKVLALGEWANLESTYRTAWHRGGLDSANRESLNGWPSAVLGVRGLAISIFAWGRGG